MPPANWEIVLAQVKTQGESMNNSFDEVKGMMRAFDERMRDIETGEAGCQAFTTGRLDAAWKKLDEHSGDLKDLKTIVSDQVLLVADIIKYQKQIQKFMNWLLGILTTVMMAVLILFATGRAQVIFK